jgi:hypothetical protein
MTASTSTVRPMATDKQQFLVFTNPVEGREDEYNEWYDNVHLGDVQRVPGITGAQRFELVETDSGDGPPPAHRYLAVYDLEGDAGTALGELMVRFGTPDMVASDALDMSTIRMSVWRPRA